jgi:hypothetical protein
VQPPAPRSCLEGSRARFVHRLAYPSAPNPLALGSQPAALSHFAPGSECPIWLPGVSIGFAPAPSNSPSSRARPATQMRHWAATLFQEPVTPPVTPCPANFGSLSYPSGALGGRTLKRRERRAPAAGRDLQVASAGKCSRALEPCWGVLTNPKWKRPTAPSFLDQTSCATAPFQANSLSIGRGIAITVA